MDKLVLYHQGLLRASLSRRLNLAAPVPAARARVYCEAHPPAQDQLNALMERHRLRQGGVRHQFCELFKRSILGDWA
jgi:hypothetical protein